MCHPKVHYRLHKTRHYSSPSVRAVQSTPFHYISLRSILILSSLLLQGFPRGLFLSWFPAENLCVPLLSPIRSTFLVHLIFPILGEEYKSGSSSSFCFFQSQVTSPLLGPVSWSALYSRTPSAYVLLSVGQTAFHTLTEDRPLATANNNTR